MKKADEQAPSRRVQKISFPWLSILAALIALTYLLLLTQPDLADFYQISSDWLRNEWAFALPGIFVLLLLLDMYHYLGQSNQQKADLKRLHHQTEELWQSKKQLQLKAHTYSGHADKLKLFISDKLLDYIEYDEKFLHFKSIAAEVRHNGVISFDKVQTALKNAANLSAQTDSPQTGEEIRAALDAMRYLWDLLDLSTADNLALHIGNLLCECEEHYYQQMLNMDETTHLPYDPVYSPQQAAWRALGLAGHEPASMLEPGMDYLLDDGQWNIHLAPVSDLLGNENHLVLLLENLLKNAQFFASRRGYKSPFSPIALTLLEHRSQACIWVYNRGPHIPDEDLPNLFQLGFSTRRAREHHGRGLGLYFVNEIVKGYEGRIRVRNIYTQSARYTVRVELESGEVITELVEVSVTEEGQAYCQVTNGPQTESHAWNLYAPVRSVEVTTAGLQSGASTQRLDGFAPKHKQCHFDPGHPERPHWQLNYLPGRKGDHQLVFEPLDISGVEFEIRLPTAQQRLDNSELDLEEDIDAEVARLDQHFRARVADPNA